MRPSLRVASLLAALGLLLVVTAPLEAPAQRGSVRDKFLARFLDQKAPDFVLPDLYGEAVRLSDFRGRPVLINFWYSSCLPCRRETPDLATLYRLFRDEGLVILGINLDDIVIPASEGLELQRFLQSVPVPYPILKGDEKVFVVYGQVPAQPTTFLIDREGTIVEVFWGARPGPVFEEAVRPYLKDGVAAQP